MYDTCVVLIFSSEISRCINKILHRQQYYDFNTQSKYYIFFKGFNWLILVNVSFICQIQHRNAALYWRLFVRAMEVVCCVIHVLYFITCSLLLLISTSLVLQKCQVVLEIFNAQDLVLIHGLCWKDLNGRNAVHVHVHVLIRSSGATTKQSVFSNCRWPDPISSNAPVWRPLVEFLLLLWYKHRLNSCIYALQTLSQIQTFNFNLWSLTKILELSL